MLLKWFVLLFVIQAAVFVNCAPRQQEPEEPGKKPPEEVLVIEKEDVESKEGVQKKHPEKIQEVSQVKEEKPKKKHVVEEKVVEQKKEKKPEKVPEIKEEEKEVVEKKKPPPPPPKKEEIKEEVIVKKKEKPRKVEEVKEIKKKPEEKEKEVVQKKEKPKKKEVIVEEKEEPKKEVVVEEKKKEKKDVHEEEDTKFYPSQMKPFENIRPYKEGKPYESKIKEYRTKIEPYQGARPYKDRVSYQSKLKPLENIKSYSGKSNYETNIQPYRGGKPYEDKPHYTPKLDALKTKPIKIFKKKDVEEDHGSSDKEHRYGDFEEKAQKPLFDFNSHYQDFKGDEMTDHNKETPHFDFGSSGIHDEDRFKTYDLHDKSITEEYGKKGEIGGTYGSHFDMPAGLTYSQPHLESSRAKHGDLGHSDTHLGGEYIQELGHKFHNDYGSDIIGKDVELHHPFEDTGTGSFKEGVFPEYHHHFEPPRLTGKYNNEVHSKYMDDPTGHDAAFFKNDRSVVNEKH